MTDRIIGLKTWVELNAERLGTTSPTLIAHMRSLVITGVLPSRGGRGPNSGTPATNETIALLLVTFMASRSAIEVAAMDKAARST